MPRTFTKGMTPAAVAALALTLAACGSSGNKGTTGQQPATGGFKVHGITSGPRGGTLKVLSNTDAQHIDPGESYFAGDYEFVSATQRALYSYRPDNSTTPVPDLAAGPPRIAPDNRSFTISIRHGIHFSPPVNREVTSADVKYAIERGFNPSVSNGYVTIYFSDVVGAKGAKGGPISGITTPDRYTIAFHLARPVAGIVSQALVLPLSAPVPKEYAARFDAKTPSQYGNNQVATGPYMFANDKAGKVVGIGYQPGKRIVLVRNPNWDPKTDFRPAYLDRIDWRIGLDTNVLGRQVLQGRDSINGDTPASGIVKLAATRYKSQLTLNPGTGNRYVALNVAIPPFDKNVNLRKAVAAALNKVAMQKTRGGPLVGAIATHFIYPGVAGFDEAGGLKGPGYDFDTNPSGDMALAKAYLRKAGFPGGKYSGPAILMVGDAADPADKTAQVVLNTFQQLGFNVDFRSVEHASMYDKCGTPKLRINVCPNVGFLKDFSDPQTVMDPTFNGKSIVPSNNNNWPQLNDPAINAAMDRAELVVGTGPRAKAWGKLDDMVTATAAAIPWFWDSQPNISSPNVNVVNAQWNEGFSDFSFTSLRK